ncbi:unnamed protein product [Closterium sp. Yama58-4]|nr:unnamed protein product [Closterium sp. Yama58-4]
MPHAPVAHAILPALMEHVSYPMPFFPPPLAPTAALVGSSHAGAAAAAAASHSTAGGVPVVSVVSVLAGGGTDVAALTLFVGLLCACIVVGHVLEGVRWINDAVTAILFGLASGAVVLFVRRGASSMILRFDEDLFFIYLLPPIIFNAGFQVKKKQFFRNFGGIMAYGIAGVFISVAVITAGRCNYLFPLLGLPIQASHVYLALGVIFSATDSVSVLQVLDQEEQPLVYSLVFGEGVVNDATSIVLFRAVQQLALSPTAHPLSLATLLNVLSDFLYLFTASTLLGVALGLLSAYVMKTLYFSSHATDREIALMALMAYASYILAEVLRLSGILSVFFAGIVMSHYTWHNVTESSRVTTKYANTGAALFKGTYSCGSRADCKETSLTPCLCAPPPPRTPHVHTMRACLQACVCNNVVHSGDSDIHVRGHGRTRLRDVDQRQRQFSEESKATATMLIAPTIALVLFSTLVSAAPPCRAPHYTSPHLALSLLVFGLLTSPLIDYFLPFTLHHSASNYSEGPSSPKYLPPHPISPASTTVFLAASPSLPPSRPRPFSSSTPVTSVSSAPSLPTAPSAPDAAPAVPSAPVRATPPRPRLLYPQGAAGHVEGDMVVCLPASSMAGLPMPDARLASRILSAHERDLHDLWRWLDDTYMRPLFGGRGYVPPAARSSSFSLPRSSSGLASAAARMLLQGGGGGSMFERLDARAAVGREEEGEVAAAAAAADAGVEGAIIGWWNVEVVGVIGSAENWPGQSRPELQITLKDEAPPGSLQELGA